MIIGISILFSLFSFSSAETPVTEDPHRWLEDVEAEDSLNWVREHNKQAVTAITQGEEFESLQQKLLKSYNSQDRIPYVGKYGDYFYNFWQDDTHPRGIWRRTTLDSYKTNSPAWETILDLDALAASENENWVWHGADCLPPEETLCLISLSRGGADADVTREFDIKTKEFLSAGFYLPEAKSQVSWIDENTLLVGTDFGEGSLTSSGYPRIVKQWRRGTSLKEAETIMEGNAEDIFVQGFYDHSAGYERLIVYQGLTFYTNRMFLQTRKGLVQLDKPDSANLSIWKNHVLIELRENWTVGDTTYKAGSLLIAPLKKWLRGRKKIIVLFSPTETSSLSSYSTTKDHILLSILDNVKSNIDIVTPFKRGWLHKQADGIPKIGTLSIQPVDSESSNDYWLTERGFLTPNTLYLGTIDGSNRPAPEKLKSLPAFFDASDMKVSQHFATSKDGTKVPYFQVAKKNLSLDGSNPTLLYGYGGFEVSLLPHYSASIGTAWLEKGGVYVLANIRGGGEYGPKWHQAALKENRHRAYEDFAAIGEDLVERKITSPEKLGIQGGSNGGLLMGNMYTIYPDHWGAIVCQVPLLDMKRYTKLLAGASWVGEYGEPDDSEQWKYIQTFSPYHNLKAETQYPPMLIMTSTRDDRVHPAHARKMTAELDALGKEVFYYENIEGGHGGAANNEQRAFMSALAYTFLWNTLNDIPMKLPAEASETETEKIE